MQRQCHTIFSVSLWTWIASLRVHEYLWRNQVRITILPGCVSIIICFWLSVNSLSSPVNGYSEGRWPVANVGIHSYLSTKASSLIQASVFCGSVRIVFFLICKESLSDTCNFFIPWLRNIFFLQANSELEEASPRSGRHNLVSRRQTTIQVNFICVFYSKWAQEMSTRNECEERERTIEFSLCEDMGTCQWRDYSVSN